MEDVIINGYTQVLLAGIGTTLTGACAYLFAQVMSLQKEMRDMQEKNFDKIGALVDRYHVFADTLKGAIKG